MSGGTVILGAGPTGLGAAYRLRERGENDFEIFERSGQVGGLATSFTDPKGWTWDVSGHIIFSGYKYFNDFLGKVLGDRIRWIDRESWIKFEDKYVRYPFQNHLSSLPEQAMLECLIGLVESQTIDKDRAFRNFEEWVLAKFGAGVAKHFMNPYNFKVWATPLKEMGYYWIAERVSVVDWRKAIQTTLLPQNTDWGPNAKFGYPLHGGTLGLWKGVVPFLGDDKVRYHKRAVSIDEEKREIAFSDGTTRSYDRLLSTMPLDGLVARLCHAPEKVRAATEKLLFNRLFSVGVGLRRPSPSDKNWIYFPNPKTPFYRMTYLSNYSPEIVPGGDTSKYFSVLTETSYSKFKPLPEGDFGKAVVDGLLAEGILQPSDVSLIETIFLIHAGHSYPIPSVERNPALETIHAYLEPRGIFSRGRFGSWKYEIGNQDHSLMQGVELVDRWIDGTDEKVFRA
ncbi:MAG TPA: FAD-dependent oxidoreductase [Thermoanaerobaculia bacterium]|nr:FAD-dependent oxidoreductase [Thermoanaerobaculia bacterium]